MDTCVSKSSVTIISRLNPNFTLYFHTNHDNTDLRHLTQKIRHIPQALIRDEDKLSSHGLWVVHVLIQWRDDGDHLRDATKHGSHGLDDGIGPLDICRI